MTTPQAIRQAMSFYSSIGKRPVHLRQETVGHVANRLQAALQREIIYLVAEGVVDVVDADCRLLWRIAALLLDYPNPQTLGMTDQLAAAATQLPDPVRTPIVDFLLDEFDGADPMEFLWQTFGLQVSRRGRHSVLSRCDQRGMRFPSLSS